MLIIAYILGGWVWTNDYVRFLKKKIVGKNIVPKNTEYDDQGYEFADDEYDPDEADEIVQAQKDESKARADAELEILGQNG